MSRGFATRFKGYILLKALVKNLKYELLSLTSAIKPVKAIPVLLYHSIGENKSIHTVHPKEFEKQMRYLKKNYEVKSLSEILDFVEGKDNPPKNVVAITFDDGYQDIYTNAYPILKKHDFPATVFITTGYCGREMPLTNIKLKMLSWDEVRKLAEGGIEIGAHTVTHRVLTELSLKEAREEMFRSKDEVEKRIGRRVLYFAYPKGKANRELLNLAKEVGFKAAFWGEGMIKVGDNPYALKRVSVNQTVTLSHFKLRLMKSS
ncbi:MAG: polysaccharide deacetylase family protein [Candidatus Bathyarchaeia archaeon]